MLKKIYTIMILLVFLIELFPINSKASAVVYSGKDGALKWNIDTEGMLTISGAGDYENEFPEWTKYSKNILSASVKVDGITCTNNMFYGCSKLKSVDLSRLDTGCVTNMSAMFYKCKKIKKIDVSSFDTEFVSDYNNMFYGCESLKKLDISRWFFEMNSTVSMLEGCNNLEEIKLPEMNDVTFVFPANNNSMWKNDDGYMSVVARKSSSSGITYTRKKVKLLKKGLKYEDEMGKYQVINITKKTLEYMGSSNHYNDEQIPDTVDIRGNTYKVTAIAKRAMKNNTEITSIDIGNNVITINDSAFEGCRNLERVTIGEKVKKIGKKAFYNCENLDEIYINSKQLKSVGSNAFRRISRDGYIKCPKKYKKLLKGKVGS